MSRSRTIAAVTLLACIIGVHLPSEVHCVEAVASTKAPPADEAANQAATGANTADKAAPASPTALTLPYNETKARRMLYFSASAYCDANRVQAWSCIPCSHPALDGFNVTHYLSDSAMDVAGYVGIDAHASADPAIRTVVVAFRGTVPSLRDWVENLDFAKAKPYAATCPDCAVHAGFLAAYEGLEHQMLAALKQLRPTRIHITGHSLGAALATLASFSLMSQGYPVASVATFGQPRVGNAAFAELYAQLASAKGVTSDRIVHYRDVVPHVPPKSFGFHHIGAEVWYSSDASSFVQCNGSGEDPTCSDSLSFPDSISDHLSYLDIAISRLCAVQAVAPPAADNES
mmetsp:Transcript_12524/g.22113  ORF Transcript_12524/g.22113 Transcript_12524/m.22113 type:complete len:345 (-) Transcript_12524:63-1097(-)